jgi:hypothetical protein
VATSGEKLAVACEQGFSAAGLVLHGDLYWLAMRAEDIATKESCATHLNVEILTALKGAIDNMRLLLWNFIEAASEIDLQRVQDGLEAQRVQRITRSCNF